MPFDEPAFRAALATETIGRQLVYREIVDTTMVVAREEAARGAGHGTLVLAEEQTAGRGRRGRDFHSPPGENLYFTLILRLDAAAAGRLPLAVPVAVCEAVRLCGVEAQVKWPNDIWAAGRKLGGMLIDAETVAAGVVAYPGIGINVNGDPTVIPELREIATSVRRELGAPVSREALLAGVCNGLEANIASPAAEMVARYRRLSLVLGRRVVVNPARGEVYEGTAASIADDGSLVVRRSDGGTETVTAADVSLRPA